jgi:hypothetical protein
MAPSSTAEHRGDPLAQEPSNPRENNSNETEDGNEIKVASVGEILYGVESFHAIVKPGKYDTIHTIHDNTDRSCQTNVPCVDYIRGQRI